LVVAACLAAHGATAVAQEEPAADPLDAVRERAALTANDDQVIDAWLTTRIDELKAAAEPANEAEDEAKAEARLIEAGTSFRKAFETQLKHQDNTPQFVARFAERTGVAMAVQFQQANVLPSKVAWYLGWVLLEMNRIETREALTAGLRHPVETVRYLCARSLARLQPEISPDRGAARDTIGLLEEAGRAESNSSVLHAIYEAMAYADHLDEATRALAAVFAARVQKIRAGRLVVADRAEVDVWDYLRQVRTRIPDAQKAALVRQLAVFLALDVKRYNQAQGPQKTTIAERIEVCELLLDSLVGPISGKGDVRSEMKKGSADPEIEMKLELLKWVGGEGQGGCLNSPPWNVPLGGLSGQP